jgi:hypothetical protein
MSWQAPCVGEEVAQSESTVAFSITEKVQGSTMADPTIEK